MPATSLLLLASTGPLGSVVRSPGGPPGSQGPGPCQVDRTSSHDGSRDGQSGSSSPLFGLLSAARRLRARAFVVVPQGCAGPLVVAHEVVARSCARPFAATPLVCVRPSVAVPRVACARPCLVPLTLTPRAWQRWLSRPRQRVRRWRCPWPGLVQRPRPAVLPLVRSRQCLRVQGASHPRSRPWQQARDGLGSQVRCPVLTTLPLVRAGLHTDRVVSKACGDGVRWRAIQRLRPFLADSRARGCRMKMVKMRMKKFEGQSGQHAARSPRMVCECFAPPRAVMLTLNRQPN